MDISHEFKGTKHRVLVNGKAGPWAIVTSPAVFNISKGERFVIPSSLSTSPAFPVAGKAYIVQDLAEITKTLPA